MTRSISSRIRRKLGLPLSFGDAGEIEPISRQFGFDRGTPVDRHYIAAFLTESAARIQGHTLEVGDDSYTRAFGGDRTTRRDVIHVSPDHPTARYRGDLTQADLLPEAVFDCAVVTQTLNLIYDMSRAVANLHAALKPGGCLLLTVPGITQIAEDEWGSTWYWSLTPLSTRRLLSDVFGAEQVSIHAYGNVFAATAFLQGAAVEDLPIRKLAPLDPSYPVIIGARAVKL